MTRTTRLTLGLHEASSGRGRRATVLVRLASLGELVDARRRRLHLRELERPAQEKNTEREIVRGDDHGAKTSKKVAWRKSWVSEKFLVFTTETVLSILDAPQILGAPLEKHS